MFTQLRQFARKMKTQLLALYFAARDPRTPIVTKCLIALIVGYALSPIDLIPDVIPVLGLLDDLLILPIGIFVVVKLIPDELWREFVNRADRQPVWLPQNYLAATVDESTVDN